MLQRLSVFQDLQDVLKILRVIDENTPKPKIFHAMWMLENKMLKSNFNVNVSACGLRKTSLINIIIFPFFCRTKVIL